MACLCHASRLIYSVTEHVISEAKPKVHGDQSTSTNKRVVRETDGGMGHLRLCK
jgi:hypothetical protein